MAHGDQVAEQRPGNGPEPAGEGARSSSPSPTQRELLLLSVLALFLELLIIRWLATEVRIFAYFKNLPLMSAFLGLGLGFLWTDRKRDYFHWSAPGLLSLSMLLIFALGLGLTYLSFVDPLKFLLFGVRTAGDGHRLAPMWTTLRSLAIMLGIFALSTSIFVVNRIAAFHRSELDAHRTGRVACGGRAHAHGAEPAGRPLRRYRARHPLRPVSGTVYRPRQLRRRLRQNRLVPILSHRRGGGPAAGRALAR